MRRTTDPATARLIAAVDSESRPYTDPLAAYPTAVRYREQRGTSSTTAAQSGSPDRRGR